ncbi:MAG: hypothetical protein ABFS35_12260 [Bacteroidota bacterium]
MIKDNKHKYTILQNKNVIIDCLFGEISFKDFINAKIEQSKNDNYDPKHNVLIDFRNSILKIEEKEISELINYPKKHKEFFGERKVAYLTDSPNQVAIGMLINLENDLPVDIKIFSTLKLAIKWIGLSENDEIMIDTILKKMIDEK